jgi:hypothetical protein
MVASKGQGPQGDGFSLLIRPEGSKGFCRRPCMNQISNKGESLWCCRCACPSSTRGQAASSTQHRQRLQQTSTSKHRSRHQPLQAPQTAQNSPAPLVLTTWTPAKVLCRQSQPTVRQQGLLLQPQMQSGSSRQQQQEAAWTSGTSAGLTGNECCGCCLQRSMGRQQSGGQQCCLLTHWTQLQQQQWPPQGRAAVAEWPRY